MKVQSKMSRAILLLFGILCLLLVVDSGAKEARGRVRLIGDDFSAWRGNTGQWEIVGDTFVNPENEKLLSSKPGAGIIMNGPTGKTSNVLSKAEFGDVRAHIESMVPKGSNSGVYLMGRYGIQVLDSWGEGEPKYSDCGGI
ncbi:MAG: family 16 glycoside hydrolase [Planctomycetota bacterium]